MEITFDNKEALSDWRAVNDGVMGGRSSGGPEFENDHMIFSGTINTNGGGFSSVRIDVEPGILGEATGLAVRIKSDGRSYKLTLKTDQTFRGRTISFQGAIPQTKAGNWSEVTVPFSTLRASLFGRPVAGAMFDARKISELGIILADGQDGDFRLEIDRISSCENQT